MIMPREQNFSVRRTKMVKEFIILALIIAFFAGLYGCVSLPGEQRGSETETEIGAEAPEAAPKTLAMPAEEPRTDMSVIGGLHGVLAGGKVGYFSDAQKRSQEETAALYNFDFSQGTIVRIEEASVAPKAVRAGDTVTIRIAYALAGEADEEINIIETREIRYKGKLSGNPEVEISREQGTYFSSIPVTLPPDAKKGVYKVTVKVQAGENSDSKETSFTVK
jgi:hypothetical protein